MGSKFHLFFAFLNHWLKKEDQYSQQSPFVFNLSQELRTYLRENKNGDPEIEQIRKNLLQNKSKIQVLDLGAGSLKVPEDTREIRKITQYSTSSAKIAQLFQFFCGKTPAQNVIELGTCMGISTQYLAKSTIGRLFTLEGSEAISKEAQERNLAKNVQFLVGTIENELPKILSSIPSVDFALIDASHTYRSTKDFFELLSPKFHTKSICIIGDIHWSKGMEQAWKEIYQEPRVKLALDFFECGVLLFENPGEKKTLIMDF